MRLQESIVAERRERFLDLAGHGPELDRSTLLPDRARFCLMISDSEGVVIEAYLPEVDTQEFSRCGLGLGGLWTEALAGTNGIDMAMRLGQIVTVKGTEHYFWCFKEFACSAAPLRDAQANLIGTLTLVGSSRRRQDEIAWSEQVLRIAGTRFQARLFRKFHRERMTARLISRSQDRMRRFETIVACEEDGTILTSLPLWHDGSTPKAHRDLEGRHLSELDGVSVTLRGPTMMPPRRLVSVGTVPEQTHALRSRPGRALAALGEQSGLLSALIERARKLAAHRVPMLICGESGVGQAGFVRTLNEELGLNPAFMRTLDASRAISTADFSKTLAELRFLCEYPVEACAPTLVLHHVDRLSSGLQTDLIGFLRLFEDEGQLPVQIAMRPHLFFTVERCWQDLAVDGTFDPGFLHLIGQAILELPPLVARDKKKVLAHLLADVCEDRLSLSDQARQALLAYDWPGNLREMRSVLREAAICGNGERINLVDLPERITFRHPQPKETALRDTLLDALDRTGWNVSHAARLLGKSRATVNRWIVEQGLRRPE